MTEQAQEQKTLTINWTQIAGGALAAVTSAVLLAGLKSFGTYGTLVGAAIGSIAASTAAAIYSHYLSTSRDKVLEAARRARRTPPVPGEGSDDDLPVVEGDRTEQLPVVDRTTPDRAGEPTPGEPGSPRRKWRARHSVLLGIIAFVLAVGGIATYEVVSGSSVSAQVQGTTSSDEGVSSGILGNPITEAPATPTVTGTPTDPATSTATDSPTGTATDDATSTATETSATDDATATDEATATSDSTATSEATADSGTGSTATQSADGSGGAAGELSTPDPGATALP